MKKRLGLILLAGSLILCLTGCKSAIPEMSEEEMGLVTEYAAGLLLKYDANYQPMFLDDEKIAAEEEARQKVLEEAERRAALEAEKAEKKAKEQSERENGESSNGEGQEDIPAGPVDIAQFLELEQVSVSFNGIEFKDTYPDSGEELYFALNASPGCKLAIIHLTLTNTGGGDSNVDIFNKAPKFKLSVNGGEYHSVMTTLLENDFSVYAGTLAFGQSIDAVLVADVKEEECGQVNEASLSIRYNGETVKASVYP